MCPWRRGVCCAEHIAAWRCSAGVVSLRLFCLRPMRSCLSFLGAASAQAFAVLGVRSAAHSPSLPPRSSASTGGSETPERRFRARVRADGVDDCTAIGTVFALALILSVLLLLLFLLLLLLLLLIIIIMMMMMIAVGIAVVVLLLGMMAVADDREERRGASTEAVPSFLPFLHSQRRR